MKNLLILFLLLSIATFLNAQSLPLEKTNKKEKLLQKHLSIAPFTQFDLRINKANVYIKSGQKQEVVVKGQPVINQLITTEVVDGRWVIDLPESVKRHMYLSIYITLPELTEVTLSSGGQIIGTGQFRAAHDLSVKSNGTGEIRLAGSAHQVYVEHVGIGTIDLSNFITTDCQVKITGKGICKVNTRNTISSNIVGGGQLIYRSKK